MSKLSIILLLAAVCVLVQISAEPNNRPRPQQVPPRPPHPRNRREANGETTTIKAHPLLHVPLKPGRPQVQILPATIPPRNIRPLVQPTEEQYKKWNNIH